MHNTGSVLDSGRLARCKFLGRNDLVVEQVYPCRLPRLQDEITGECLDVCHTKDFGKVILGDSMVVFLLK